MRGDGLGVGDVGEVPCGKSHWGYASGGNDGGGSCWEHDTRVVGERGRAERGTTPELGRDGIGIDDGTRVEHGARRVHGTWAGGADGMRGDGLGVGDVGEVPGRAGICRDTAGGDDGGGAVGERDGGVFV